VAGCGGGGDASVAAGLQAQNHSSARVQANPEGHSAQVASKQGALGQLLRPPHCAKGPALALVPDCCWPCCTGCCCCCCCWF
jgi:hypothetical protein